MSHCEIQLGDKGLNTDKGGPPTCPPDDVARDRLVEIGELHLITSKKSGPGLLRGPILYGAVYIRPLPSQFILPRPSPLSNEGSIQIRGPVPKLQLKHVRCPDLPTPWREVVLADVRLVSHYGLQSGILRSPKSAITGTQLIYRSCRSAHHP